MPSRALLSVIRRLPLLLLAAAFALNLSARDVVADEGTPLGAPEVALRHDLLSVRAIDVPLAGLLRAIGEKAGFEVIIKGDLSGPVTWSFADVPVEEGVRRLLHDTSSVMIYARVQDGGTGSLAKVITFHQNVDLVAGHSRVARTIPTQETGVSQETPIVSPSDHREDRLAAVRHLANRLDASASKDLALLLFEDEDPLIRRIAAIALGKLRLPEAKAALKAALSDEDTQVRRRAIQGLGKAWGKEAVEPLSVALAEDPDPGVRRQAALSLGRIFSGAAYQVLDAARFDTDVSVRRAVLAGLARLENM